MTVAPADPDRTIFVDDARRLETLRAELAAAGVPTPPPATEDVLDTGEVQPRLPGAEAVREQEQATPTLEAPFALTSEVAGGRRARRRRSSNATRALTRRSACISSAALDEAPCAWRRRCRDAGYRFGPMLTPAEKRAGLDLLQQLIEEAEGPLEQELFQTELPQAPAFGPVEEAAALDQVVPKMRGTTFARRRDLKVWLQERVRAAAAAAGVSLDTSTPETQDYIVRVAVRDALHALAGNTSAIGWYDLKTRQALAVLATIHPEIATDANARFAFTFALAVMSNGLQVNQNFELAERAYQHYKRTGQFRTDGVGVGTSAEQQEDALELFNTLIEKWGIEDTRKFMLTPFTVAELRRMDFDVSGEAADQVVRGAAVIGPKIGNGFFSNLYGYFEALTIDRWLMRTWGRWSGELFADTRAKVKENRTRTLAAAADLVARAPRAAKAFGDLVGIDLAKVKTRAQADALANEIARASTKPATRDAMQATARGDELRRAGNIHSKNLDAQKEAPAGPQERQLIRQVMGRVLQHLKDLGYTGMTTADLQALLWYPEKRFYDAATTEEDVAEGYEPDEAPDYANAAVALARANKVPQADITAALEGVSRVATVSPGRTGRGAARSRQADAEVVAREVGAPAAGVTRFTPAEKRRFLERYARPVRNPAKQPILELFQGAPPAPSFYSRLVRAVEASPQGRASGAQWKATIKNAKIGINLEEYTLVSSRRPGGRPDLHQGGGARVPAPERGEGRRGHPRHPIGEQEILDLASRLQSDRMHEARDRTEPPDFDINIGDVSIEYRRRGRRVHRSRSTARRSAPSPTRAPPRRRCASRRTASARAWRRTGGTTGRVSSSRPTTTTTPTRTPRRSSWTSAPPTSAAPISRTTSCPAGSTAATAKRS